MIITRVGLKEVERAVEACAREAIGSDMEGSERKRERQRERGGRRTRRVCGRVRESSGLGLERKRVSLNNVFINANGLLFLGVCWDLLGLQTLVISNLGLTVWPSPFPSLPFPFALFVCFLPFAWAVPFYTFLILFAYSFHQGILFFFSCSCLYFWCSCPGESHNQSSCFRYVKSWIRNECSNRKWVKRWNK